MKKLKSPILLDMDGVFADWVSKVIELAKRYPELHKAIDVKLTQSTYNLSDYVQHDEVLMKLLMLIENDKHLFKIIEPTTDEVISDIKNFRKLSLSDNRDIFICTAPTINNLNCYSDKAFWIEKYFGNDWLENLLLVRDKTLCLGIILIDDKPVPLGKHIPLWKHVVFDQPYNRHVKKTRIFNFNTSTCEGLLEYANILDKAL